jgi:hypothetical protein
MGWERRKEGREQVTRNSDTKILLPISPDVKLCHLSRYPPVHPPQLRNMEEGKSSFYLTELC